jgi:hypothetical protein
LITTLFEAKNVMRIPKRDPKSCDVTTKIAGFIKSSFFLKLNNNSLRVSPGLK